VAPQQEVAAVQCAHGHGDVRVQGGDERLGELLPVVRGLRG
jgi:hypothetical protein